MPMGSGMYGLLRFYGKKKTGCLLQGLNWFILPFTVKCLINNFVCTVSWGY
jgi:hypothetical protein